MFQSKSGVNVWMYLTEVKDEPKHDTRLELLVRISIATQYNGKITCYFQTTVSKLALFIHAHIMRLQKPC